MWQWLNSGSLVLVVMSFVMSLQSCSDTEVLQNPDYSQAIQLRKGNFWVYDFATTDLLSGNRKYHQDDSIFVAKDTIIGNSVYFIVENLYGLHEIKREMSGMIVGVDGAVEFSATNFVDTLFKNADLGLYGIMAKEEAKITVPAGSFSTVCFILLQRNRSGHHNQADSNNPSVYNREFSVVKRVWYARNIGIVKSAQYFGNVAGSERELKRYYIQ